MRLDVVAFVALSGAVPKVVRHLFQPEALEVYFRFTIFFFTEHDVRRLDREAEERAGPGAKGKGAQNN